MTNKIFRKKTRSSNTCLFLSNCTVPIMTINVRFIAFYFYMLELFQTDFFWCMVNRALIVYVGMWFAASIISISVLIINTAEPHSPRLMYTTGLQRDSLPKNPCVAELFVDVF